MEGETRAQSGYETKLHPTGPVPPLAESLHLSRAPGEPPPQARKRCLFEAAGGEGLIACAE